jgi:hypothetical protein
MPRQLPGKSSLTLISQRRPTSIRAIAADGSVTCESDDAGPANAFVQGGNAFGTLATLGTTDGQTVQVIANGSRVMRWQPTR